MDVVVAYLWNLLEDATFWDRAAVTVLSTIVLGTLGFIGRRIWRWIKAKLWPKHQLDFAIPRLQPHWVRRDADLDKILRCFFPAGADGSATDHGARRVLVHAGGGFGKSTLAAHFALEHAKRFAGVWWIHSEFAGPLKSKWREVSQQTRAMAQPTLYVFDNVSEATKANVKFLVETLPHNACALVTARTADWLPAAQQVELKGLDVPAAAELLRNLANSEDIVGSERLARDLGGQPLALIHAGTRCRASLSFAEYRTNIARYLQDTPPDPDYGRNEYAVVRESLEIVAQGGGAQEAMRLAEFLAYCAAGRIPRALYNQALNDPAKVDAAVSVLRDNVLVSAVGDPNPGLSMHRVVQAVIRHEVKSRDAKRGAEVISDLLEFLYNRLLIANAAQDPDYQEYLPHLLQVLAHVEEPAFRRSDKGDLLDATVKQVVLDLTALLEAASDANIRAYVPDLPKLVGRYYEVDRLRELLIVVLRRMQVPSATWEGFRDDCLAADNYVLRYALADALAGRTKGDTAGGAMQEIENLLRKPKSLNHFELGGYALKSVYSDMPEQGLLSGLFTLVRGTQDARINTGLLSLLAKHPCYPGRSILGDLMLNLVYQLKRPSLLLPPDDGNNHRFWQPIWDFVTYDVNAIRAAEFANCNAHKADPPPGEEHKYREQLEALCRGLLGRLRHVPHVCEIVQNYFTIGANADDITHERAVLQFQKLARAEPKLFDEVLGLLFAHPLWSVAEAAASVVAKLLREAERDHRQQEKNVYLDVIESRFDRKLPWRVCYGAMEAAYQIRLDEEPQMATFSKGVRLFYNDPVSKLRGLCAENLFSVMLNASDRRRAELESKFDEQIRYWLKDEDCWVLDHAHRYFHTLHSRGVTASHFTSTVGSRLFVGLNDWWMEDRETFLENIENQKSAIRNRELTA